MTVKACIAQIKSEGKIDDVRARRFEALFDEIEAGFKKRYGDASASVLAGEETLKALDYDVALRRRQAALQIDAQRRAMVDIERYDGGSGKKDGAAVRAMMGDDLNAPYENIERRTERIELQMQRKLEGFIRQHRRNMLGQVSDKAGAEDVIRARHGDRVDNQNAKAFSDAIGEVFEYLRDRFNQAGGDIGHRADFGIPHKHDARLVRAAGYQKWKADILPELAVDKMVDPLTGGEFTDEALERALRASWENIRTDGRSGLAAAQSGGGAKLANRRSDPRFLQYKDGNAWLRYAEKYGSGDAFTAIMDHVRGMAHDIATMERLGPDPDATVKFLTNQVTHRLAQSDDASAAPLNRLVTEEFRIKQMWATVSGRNNIPSLGGWLQSTAVRANAGARDVLTAAMLGSSPLSAIGDMQTVRATRMFNGLVDRDPITRQVTEPLHVAFGYLRQLNPLSDADRKLAVRLELGLRDASQALTGLSRYFEGSQGPETTKILADSFLRLSGINKFTEAGQRTFGLDFLGSLADVRDSVFGDLRPALRESMGRYGITEADWNVMRSSPVHKERGGEWMAADLISDPKVGDKMMDMVLAETVAAVQVTTAHSRALANWGAPGTLPGEASRNLLQFKSFTAALMMTQGQRIVLQGPLKGAQYGINLAIGLTVFGAASIQLRQIIKGQDPRPMDNWEFWMDAITQGGGIGILGDLIGSFKSDRGGGLASVVGGPVVGAVNDLGQKFAGNVKRAYTGRDTTIAKDAVAAAERYTPGTSTWYTRLAVQRLLWDRLEELSDPNYRQSWRRMEKRARDQRASYYWNPGETAPDRAPDVNNALGAKP